MRTLKVCALSLALLPALSLAQSNDISCKNFAAKQLKEVKKEYYGALTSNEIALTLNVAERSCNALFDTVEEERTAIQTDKPSKGDKEHWWEKEGRATPNIKKAQQSGGK